MPPVRSSARPGARHPPVELLSRPRCSAGSGWTRSEWPKIQPYWTRPLSIPSSSSRSSSGSPSACAEVRLDLVVAGVDPPRVVAEVPGELDRGRAGRGQVPVEQDHPRRPSSPRLSSRRSPWISVTGPSPRSARRERRGVPDRASTSAPTSSGTDSANASQAASSCFGSRSVPARSASATAARRHPKPVAQRRRLRRDRRRRTRRASPPRPEDPSALLARQPPLVAEEASPRGRASRPTRRRRRRRPPRSRGRARAASGRRPRLPQQRRPPAVARHPAEPVGAGPTRLAIELEPVGEHDALERRARVAAVRSTARRAPGSMRFRTASESSVAASVLERAA